MEDKEDLQDELNETSDEDTALDLIDDKEDLQGEINELSDEISEDMDSLSRDDWNELKSIIDQELDEDEQDEEDDDQEEAPSRGFWNWGA